MGRRGAARLHRVPGRLVEEPSAVRDRARPSRADRAAADVGRGQAQLQLALPRAAGDGRDGHAALGPRARASRTSCARRIRERAEGVPLYAVETVRMLLDRGLLVQRGSTYVPAGADRDARGAGDAARADRRPPGRARRGRATAAPGRRRARQDVHGRGARDAQRAAPAAEVEPVLAGLARKEVLSLSADPLSPERGQYGFLQDLVRRVAYEMLSKHERRAKHLAAAATGRAARTSWPRSSPATTWRPTGPTRTLPTRTTSPAGRSRRCGRRASGRRRSRPPSRRSATTSRRRRSPAMPSSRPTCWSMPG